MNMDHGKISNITQPVGLTLDEVKSNLVSGGYNELPSQKKQNGFMMLFKILSEPMLMLLLGSGVIYLFLGEVQDALLLMSFIFVVIGITFYQERKTEKTLELLKKLSSPKATVIRGGEIVQIPSKEVVMEDVLVLREGDRVPADAVVLSCVNLTIDESLLTGESVPVRKSHWDGKLTEQTPGGDDLPFVYSGTVIVSGRGYAKVTNVGIRTEIGKIGKSLEMIKDEDTLLHKETAKIVRSVAIIALILCVIVVLVYVFLKGNLIQGILAGLTLGMAMLPEEFPVVLLIFLTLGSWRISKKKVLTRRSAVIETLGAATVLCTDKTGTLTLNKMSLSQFFFANEYYNIGDSDTSTIPNKFRELIEYAVLACQPDTFDPMEKEIKRIKASRLDAGLELVAHKLPVKEYPLTKSLLAMSHVWKASQDEDFIVATKGAPETILNLCHLDNDQKVKLLAVVDNMSKNGLRVLGVAKANHDQNEFPEDVNDYTFEFIGFLGFVDPIRTTVYDAVNEAYSAGIRTIMITGDYIGTAQYVAKSVGIKNPELYLTGEQLVKLTDKELRDKVKTVNVFARVVPEQKLIIINALKANNEIVAMTGDGVNDASALKSAHIGIAMGQRGTDVAREASSLVLLNDDFSSIVSAVRLGRRIFNNLKKSMGYILAVHVPIAGMSILPLLFDLPVMLLPAHIAFLELIIDPACSTIFEAEKEDKNIMNLPPRNISQPMFSRATIFRSLIQGTSVLVAVFLIFFVALKSGQSDIEARSMSFTFLVLANILSIVINLSSVKNIFQTLISGNKTLFLISGGAIFAICLITYTPFLADIFRLTPLHLNDLLIVLPSLIICFAWLELIKFITNSNTRK
jgi:Ca2+-transporting ATPase